MTREKRRPRARRRLAKRALFSVRDSSKVTEAVHMDKSYYEDKRVLNRRRVSDLLDYENEEVSKTPARVNIVKYTKGPGTTRYTKVPQRVGGSLRS